MVKVLYDFDAFKLKADGVSRCMVELISHLPEDIKYEISIKVSDNLYLPSTNIKPDVKPCKVSRDNFLGKYRFKGKNSAYYWVERHFKSFPTYFNVNKPISISALKKQDFDLFHCPSTTADTYFLDYLGGKPFVLTVHDMISEIFYPAGNIQTKIKEKLIPLASHIVTISNQTKEDLVKIMGVPESKISVIYHGSPKVAFPRRKRIIDSPYFLYVGTRPGYKNFEQTLMDFSLFQKDHRDCRLVVTGSPFSKYELALLDKLSIRESVINMFASDEELMNLYQNAIAFIFPSLYEGFGLPILEAFVNDCPVLLNDTSCFPEIAQDAAIYFHSRPDEKSSNLVEKMEMVYNMSIADRDELIEKGRIRGTDFSWSKSATELANVYKTVLNSI